MGASQKRKRSVFETAREYLKILAVFSLMYKTMKFLLSLYNFHKQKLWDKRSANAFCSDKLHNLMNLSIKFHP